MSVDCFLDTNVIVYAAAGGKGENAKPERALALIETRDFGLSAQILQEFYVTVVHKIEVPLAPSEALEWIEQLEMFPACGIELPIGMPRFSPPQNLWVHPFSTARTSAMDSATDRSRS